MDTFKTYRNIVKELMLRYSKLRPSHGDIRLDVVFDDQHDRYALMQAGWDRGRRVRGNLLYVVLEEGKVVIEYDGMERGIVDELVKAGIPREQIVLAFLPEQEQSDLVVA